MITPLNLLEGDQVGHDEAQRIIGEQITDYCIYLHQGQVHCENTQLQALHIEQPDEPRRVT